MTNFRQLIFIDDSGDPGFKKGVSSTNFIMAAVLFIDSESATSVNNAISEYRRSLGWKDKHEFKFRTTAKNIKLHFLKLVSKYDFKIYAVYVDKSSYPNIFNFSDDEKLYNWTAKELLTLMPLKDAEIKMDGKYSKGYKLRVKTYIRQNLNTKNHKKVKSFDARDSKLDNLIQLADIIAGSINRSLQPEKTDSNEYIQILNEKIVEIRPLNLGKNN